MQILAGRVCAFAEWPAKANAAAPSKNTRRFIETLSGGNLRIPSIFFFGALGRPSAGNESVPLFPYAASIFLLFVRCFAKLPCPFTEALCFFM
jgi:hypothetical protein